MAAGAIAGYAVQVGENRSQGMDWGKALTTNISDEKILGGAVIAGGAIIGAVVVSVGLTAIGVAAGAACMDGDCTNEVQEANTAISALGNNADDLNSPIGTAQKATSTINTSIEGVKNVIDKARTVDEFLTDTSKFIGTNYQKVASGIYRAENGLRQVRFTERDLQPTHDSIGPHGHFELLNQFGEVYKNIHIPIIGQ
jgi:hypothetical protein